MRGRRRAFASGLALGAVLLAPAPLVAAAVPVVTAIEIRSDAPLERHEELRELIAVVPGELLDPAAVARTLHNLHAYGAGGEIAAFTRPTEGGVVVVFALWVRYQVEEVRLVGEPGLRRQQLLRVLPQRTDQPLGESKVIRGVFALQDLYRTSGYLEATVRVAVDLDEARKRATVTYHVASGRRARVGAIQFSGDVGPFTAAELMSPLDSEPGRHHHQVTGSNDAERLEEWLFGRAFRSARVDPPLELYDADTATIDLSFPVQVGPRFEFVAEDLPVARLRRRGLLPFLGAERFDEALLLQSRASLVRHYQEKGHYDVSVELVHEETAEGVVLRLAIEPGPVYRLGGVRFRGNEAVDDRQLAALMETAPGGQLLGGGGRLVDEVLQADLANIRSYYALQGYGDARVGPVEVERRDRRLELTVPVVEGRQRRVVDLAVVGASRLDVGELVAELPLQAAGPFHPRLLEQSLEQVRVRYEAEGMRATQVAADLDWNDDRTLVDVRIKVFEGPRTEVDRVIVRGHQRTRPGVIRHAAGLRPGTALSTGRLLEAQRQLYGLGVFSRAEVKMAPGTPFTAERDVLVRVEEGRNRNVAYGVGYDSENGVRGLFGLGYRNLFGRAVSGRLDVRASQRETQVRALVRQPFVAGRPWPITYSLSRIEEERGSFDSKRRGAQIEAQRLGQRERYGLLLSYRQVEVAAPDPALQILEIDRELREAEILSFGPSLFYDRRDDPFNPRRGWSSNLSLEYALPAAGTDSEFVKLFGQQTAQVDLRRFGVVAASLRLGLIEPRGSGNTVDPTVPAGLPSAQVPISERFFAGGRASHRAYRRDRLGVLGESLLLVEDAADAAAAERLVPIGGTALALLNVDYRFPIAGPVGGVAFIDFGNVWADWRSVDPTEAKAGAGLGVRYLSPIGPIRLEIGWKLDREPSEDSFVVLFSVGNPF